MNNPNELLSALIILSAVWADTFEMESSVIAVISKRFLYNSNEPSKLTS